MGPDGRDPVRKPVLQARTTVAGLLLRPSPAAAVPRRPRAGAHGAAPEPHRALAGLLTCSTSRKKNSPPASKRRSRCCAPIGTNKHTTKTKNHKHPNKPAISRRKSAGGF